VSEPKHHPTLNRTGRHGCWATCRCGWQSGIYRTVTGAHLAFGNHLTEAERLDSTEEQK